jgi:DNA mismatch repair protein MutS2
MRPVRVRRPFIDGNSLFVLWDGMHSNASRPGLFRVVLKVASMDEKTLATLEYPKILERLAGYAAFSASADLARSIRPTADFDEVMKAQARTTEARRLLDVNSNVGVGGAHDVRPLVDRAARRAVLEPSELLAIKDTLISARELSRVFERGAETYPVLTEIGKFLPPPPGIVDVISKTISDRGEVLDTASPKLGSIRGEIKVAHERLLAKLQKMVSDSDITPMLQEALITQRSGRYVIPLRAEFKGRVRSIIHDQSSSGATLFVEPLVIVDLNNQWHELQLAERDEVRRILAELSDQVGAVAESINLLVDSLAKIDLALMCAKYAEDIHASEPILESLKGKGRPNHPGSVIRLDRARHPLLDSQSVVPIDVILDDQTFSVVITGPNTGGKTVTLKTVGLLVLMAQSGLHIPARSGSALSIFHEVFADIGDEQSIEQSLSTFSGHIRNIVRILRRADEKTLVLFDELGAGTDPQEGAALARSILTHLVSKRIPCMVATHYPELKVYAHGTAGVINASMEFDVESLRPTYHLTIGLPGRSNALAIARRLGLPPEIIDGAKAELNPDDLRAEDLLNEIHRQRDLTRRARQQAENSLKHVEKQKTDLASRLEKIEDERHEILEKARQKTEVEIADLQDELEDLRRQMSRARQPLEALKPLQEQVNGLSTRAEKAVARQVIQESAPRPLRLGDKVRVRTIKMDGVITAMSDTDFEVQLGNLRVRARTHDIHRIGDPEPVAAEDAAKTVLVRQGPATKKEKTAASATFYPSPGMELDLRGQRVEDALEALDRYLESAFLAGLPFVRIIHGKGTGRLRQVIREALGQSSHVKSWEAGGDKEGGEGVTVAKMAV